MTMAVSKYRTAEQSRASCPSDMPICHPSAWCTGLTPAHTSLHVFKFSVADVITPLFVPQTSTSYGDRSLPSVDHLCGAVYLQCCD